eukprot:gnl/MRDRNA2_/MRDRNA2_97720_c0_seq1.p1 gnl/MRDRNA2_/MRDRNA2_97720_c0~~gnl/MRDRNA2_/MRDRNA2_97720_c0_seq1.p1  ORF type:complete len:350 (+),score=90.51 gnl/MRDRNA2_/MRDRNA2_97720_c0_seq1:69-1118(+)
MAAKKKAAVASIAKELEDQRMAGLNEVHLMKFTPSLKGPVNDPEAIYRRQIIFKNFRVRTIWNKSQATVLGPGHPGYCKKSREAVICNTIELFEHELKEKEKGLSLKELTDIHQKYCGPPPPDFKEVIGMELKEFVKNHFEYDEKKGKVRKKPEAPPEPAPDVDLVEKETEEEKERIKKKVELEFLMDDPSKVQSVFEEIWGHCSTKLIGSNHSANGRGTLVWGRPPPLAQDLKQEDEASRAEVLEALLSAIKRYDHESLEQNKLKAKMEEITQDKLDKADVQQLFRSSLFSLQAMHKRASNGEPLDGTVQKRPFSMVPAPDDENSFEAQAAKKAMRWLDKYTLTSKKK